MCLANNTQGDACNAFLSLKTNSVGRALANADRPPAIAAFLFNDVLFSLGAFYAILPFFVMLFLHLFRVWRLSMETWAFLLPIVNCVVVYTFFVWFVFHFVVDLYFRTYWCVLTSG